MASIKLVLLSCVLYRIFAVVSGFWDDATTTALYIRTDITPRQSFFRWQETQPEWKAWTYWSWDWAWLRNNRRLCVVAGISHGFKNIGTATILNRRTLLTACNLLDEFTNVQRDLRIWALGSRGYYNTPYRYRVWRFTRMFPKSLNPEHWHGPSGAFQPRHDVCVIHTLDMMMITTSVSSRGHFPSRSYVAARRSKLTEDLWFTGSGYEYPLHIKENFKIFITKMWKNDVVDCSEYLPKWWGKFICMKNIYGYPGVQNGGGLHSVGPGSKDNVVGLGCFEIRYNDDRIFVFTDVRYYEDQIHFIAHLYNGEYYEYAYPQWGTSYGYLYNSVWGNAPMIPGYQVQTDFYPLGKK